MAVNLKAVLAGHEVEIQQQRVDDRSVNSLSYLFALAAGAANPVQAGANAQLNKSLASPLWACLRVYASGLIGVLAIRSFAKDGPASDWGAVVHGGPGPAD
jgi:hypothetical protein